MMQKLQTYLATDSYFYLLSIATTFILGSRDGVVGIATGYELDDVGVGVRVPVRSRIFSSPRCPAWLWSPLQPPFRWVPGALSPGVKRTGREADH
jgi:hypothetical protein